MNNHQSTNRRLLTLPVRYKMIMLAYKVLIVTLAQTGYNNICRHLRDETRHDSQRLLRATLKKEDAGGQNNPKA